MDYALSRFNMIEGQIKTNRVTDPLVLDAMGEIPREAFVPNTKKGVAYIDDAVEVAKGRFLLEPMVMGRMLEAAELGEDDIVLDIGCNSGYSTAVLAKIVSTVVALECDEELAKTATETLNEQGIDNAVVVTGNLKDGVAKQAPYNVILFNGSIEELPDSIKNQLADGGRLVVVTSGKATMSTISVYTRNDEIFSKRDVMEAGVAPLPGFGVEKGFSF
ncbi:Protein-L-isoaspartate(D-aspartate) O-methyltransferase [Candidatus Terasakiella magnetica]|uniref:Protein-L-isoaspartate O-methyltransferase n=1 Tax=Candidatus Terasakiella magnetica TaxID=1867952 RepID=A0A1C3RCB7_9PROT|nr:protein-L-isoaspartate O-methyltransferase [Candidatus Terasakiella magnetica]SCA54911.1 Protein-L-isoaspartate(D-aspartate) O-methyltransferase [Candidatus Terasakiella magnetica]